MPTCTKFEDLPIWLDARGLCKDIYRITKYEDFAKDMRFVSQIRAAAGSIMDNIAEGFERSGNREFIQFLYIANGSCAETRSQVIVLLIAIIFLKMNIKTLSISLLTLVSPFTTSSIILKIPNTKAKNTNPKAPQYTNHSNPQISQLFDTHFVRI